MIYVANIILWIGVLFACLHEIAAALCCAAAFAILLVLEIVEAG